MKNSIILNIALCGCGHIAQKHFDAIAHNAHLKLTAIVDTQEDTREQFSKTLNVPAYDSLESLHQHHPKLDLIALCTPSGLHAEQTTWAAQKGWHIISEKPLATTLQDGQSMLKSCQEAGVKLFLVHQLRYNPIIQAIKQAIEAGHFGQIYMATAEVFWNRPQEYFDSISWRGNKQLDGGAYLNQACHFVDLMQWLLGDVIKVQAMMRTLARNIETEDSGIINLEFANHALGSIAVTLLNHSKNLRGSLSIIGEKGSVIVEGPCLDKITVWDFVGAHRDAPCHRDAPNSSIKPTGHHQFYDQVISSLNDASQAAITGEEGYKTLEIIMAAHQASELGKEIYL